jgi:hypothetical protein
MKSSTHQSTLHLSFNIKCCVDRLRPPSLLITALWTDRRGWHCLLPSPFGCAWARIALAAASKGARLVFRGLEDAPIDDLARLALAGKGCVSFE